MSETFRQGIEQFQAGNFSDAEAVFRKICGEEPSNFRAKGLLGAALANTGNPQEGLKVVEQAFSESSYDPMVGVVYVQLLNQAGKTSEAQDAARKSVTEALSIGDADLLLETADGLRQANMPVESATAYNHAMKKTSLDVEQGLIAAAVNTAAGSQEGALVHLNALAEAGVRDERVFKSAAEILKSRASWQQLYNATKILTEIDPNNADYWDEHAAACQNLSHYKESAEAFDRKIALKGATSSLLATSARLWLMANNKARAGELIEQAKAADGVETADAQTMIGMAAAMQGDRDTTIACLQKAIKLDPLRAEAYVQLSLQQNGALDESMVDGIRAAAEQENIDAADIAALRYVIGDAHKAKNEYANAFAEYEKANAILRECARQIGASYNPSRENELARRVFSIGRTDTPEGVLEPIPFKPIFVIGMPRTGTTLMEGLLAAHSNAAAGGEPAAMITNFNAYFRELNSGSVDINGPLFQSALNKWRENYIDVMSLKRSANEDFVVDKQPLNFKAVGLINMVFPEAPIVYMQRNPVDTCFSIFRRPFGEVWAFANHLHDLAHFYGIHARYIRYWEEKFPGKLIKVQYEDLIENFDSEARRVVEACGLGWEDACLNPGGADRVTSTFSSTQARSGVSKEYTGDGERFADFLGPLRDGLTGAGIDLKTGGLIA